MYRVDVTSVVGLPQFSGWSQVVSNNFNSAQLVCAFAIAGNHAGNAGRDLMTVISQAEIRSPQDLQKLMSLLINQATDLGVTMQLSCGIFSADKVVLGTNGGSVFLKRGERTGLLLSSTESVKIVAGKRQSGDVVVLITQQAESFLNEIEQRFKRGFDLDSVVTSIVPGLQGQHDSSLSSIAFIQGGQDFSEKSVETKKSAELKESAEVEKLAETEQPPKAEESDKFEGQKVKANINLKDLNADTPSSLSRLGKSDQSSQGQSHFIQPLKKVFKKVGSLVKKVWQWLFQLGWQSLWKKIRIFLKKIKNFFVKILQIIVSFFRKLTARDVYLTSSPQRLRRVTVAVILGAILLIGGTGTLIYKSKQRISQTEIVLAPILAQLSQARTKLAADPIQARESVSAVITQLEQLEKDYADQKKSLQLVKAELATARQLYDDISGQEEFDQLEIFYDLRLADNDFIVSRVDANDHNALFLDSGKKQAIGLDLETKQLKKIDFSERDNITDIELNENEAYLLGQGVSSVDITDKKITPQEIIPEGDSNRAATFLESFATYIYILNPQKRNIYRYAQQEEGYSKPIGWVGGAAGFDYDKVTSWAIDGEVWVATQQGEIHRLVSGQEAEFKVTGLAKPFTHSLQLFTNENLKNLYVLEPNANRLVVLTKDGKFLKEITSTSLSSTTALFVSEEMGKAFAVSGSIVYSMGI